MKLFKHKYSAKSILQQFDKCADDFTFPMLDNGYIYHIESRMTGYRDTERWILIIEVVGFNIRGGGHNGINNCLHIFGNCLSFPPGTNNDNVLYMTDNVSNNKTFDEEYEEHLNQNVNSMLLREKEIKVNHDIEFYLNKGIELEEPSKIMIWEFLRGLIPEYSLDLLATEKEIRKRIPKDIPEFFKLNEWFHPDLADSEKPSNNETFKMIAKALETGIINEYKPTKEPNNHWKNWPDGGTL